MGKSARGLEAVYRLATQSRTAGDDPLGEEFIGDVRIVVTRATDGHGDFFRPIIKATHLNRYVPSTDGGQQLKCDGLGRFRVTAWHNRRSGSFVGRIINRVSDHVHSPELNSREQEKEEQWQNKGHFHG